jgi:20S proteasome alpha/beta subunit
LTVAIAAICHLDDTPYVVGAADRMLTAGDIAVEHPHPKIVALTSRIVALSAGDVTAHLAISRAAAAEIGRRRVSDVAAAAEIVGAEYRGYRGRVAELRILAPLGLTRSSFIAHQRELATDLAAQVSRAMADHVADVETIVAGVDDQGGHVFHVGDPGQVTCYDGIGFAAIGNGSRHAVSFLLQVGYTPQVALSRAVVLVYTAKKRAEVAPGVGSTTDIFGIGERYYFPPDDETRARMETAFRTIRDGEQAVLEAAIGEFDDYLRAAILACPRRASASSAHAEATPDRARGRRAQSASGDAEPGPGTEAS